jgi:hypothetical protein
MLPVMTARTFSALLLLVCVALAPGCGHAQPPMRAPGAPRAIVATAMAVQEPGLQCRQAIRAAERAAGLPDQLMAAIGHVESGRPDAQGVINPWPWTINVEGEGHIYDSKAEAIAAVRAYQARGVRSIDVGCMQVNLMFHPDAFASLEQAFDPTANAVYAARFLNELYAQTHSWPQATAFYHSATPELGADYQRKVAAVLPDELRRPRDAAGGNVWSNNVWTANVWNTGPGAVPVQPGAAGSAGLPFGPAGGGYMLSNHAGNARMLPAPANVVGRGLAAYRAVPIPVASRVLPRAPL